MSRTWLEKTGRMTLLRATLALGLIPTFLFSSLCWGEALSDEAAVLYERSRPSIFQLRVVDLSTGKKSGLGSGFYISAQGDFITNYHVVAEYVMRPEQHSIEYVTADGAAMPLSLLYFDVVHDLALLRSEAAPSAFLQLSDTPPVQGERMFSLGDPYDLGFMIVEGTFNGLMKKSRYRKYLFSGSLNPGMSGGPAINRAGHVIGVNVSTMGNDLSFIVPVEFVREMCQTAQTKGGLEATALKALIEQQILSDQSGHLEQILAKDWDPIAVGDITVPGEIAEFIKCWGRTSDEKHALFKKINASCESTESIYVSSEIETGQLDYQFSLHESKGLNRFGLYHHLARDMKGWFMLDESIAEDDEDFTRPRCTEGFVTTAKRTWKVTQCAQQYKQFQSLYDVQLILCTVDRPQRAVIGYFLATGITRSMSAALLTKFLNEIRWRDSSSK
jgi:S1-C subfamily serine protease